MMHQGNSAPTGAGLEDFQLQENGMSEVLACAVAQKPGFLCCVEDSEGVQTRQHESIALMLRPGRTAPKAHAKLSFSMEGVFERVMPGEGYQLPSGAY